MKDNLEQVCVKILKKYKKQIKSILLDEENITLIVSKKAKEIKSFVSKIDKKIKVVNDDFYLKKIFLGEKRTYTKLGNAAIIYDPNHFIDPLQEMIKSGKIHGTKEDIKLRFIAIGEHFRKINMIKHKILDNIYMSIVEVGQAVLIEKFNIFCKPREVVENLTTQLNKKKKLEKKYINIAKEIIRLYKDIEHKKRDLPSGKELDLLQKKAEDYQNRMIELLNPKI